VTQTLNELRVDLLNSLIKRFDPLFKNDIFKIATILDPYYGLKYIPPSDRTEVLRRLKLNLYKIKTTVNPNETPVKDKVNKYEEKRNKIMSISTKT
jgi:hypothetical protein